MNEDLFLPVGAPGKEIGSLGLEGHEPTVGADGGRAASLVRLAAITCDAHPHGLARVAVVHEDVPLPVRVTVNEIGSLRLEGYEATVAADGRFATVGIGFRAVAGHAHPPRLAGLPVPDEDVLNVVGVSGDEVLGAG